MEKLDILNFEILLGVWLKSQTQKMLEKHGVVTASFPGFSPTNPYGRVNGRVRSGRERERERRAGQRTWERGWEQFLRRSIIILEEDCGNVDDIYLVILRFQCNKQDMGVLRVISNRELSY